MAQKPIWLKQVDGHGGGVGGGGWDGMGSGDSAEGGSEGRGISDVGTDTALPVTK